MQYLLISLILIPVLFGIIVYILPNKFKNNILFLVQIVELFLAVVCLFKTLERPIKAYLGGYKPPVGIMLFADTISAPLVLLSVFLFTCLIIYSTKKHYADATFYMLYLILEGLTVGLFFVDDMFTIYIFAEVSIIVVSLLIMYKKDSRSIYDGKIYLLVNIFSMTFYLLGIVILYKTIGTFSLQMTKDILAGFTEVKALYLPFSLIITSVSLKAALMPLFTWLPKAHGTPSAPSVVSAVLSGLYVKGGVYLFIRFTEAFVQIDVSLIFYVCGVITAIIGMVFAFCQTDIKLLLSYSTVSQIGIIMIGINTGTMKSLYGAVYHIISHAVFKSLLFLCAGIIIEKYKTRDMRKIEGVFRSLPLVSICAIFGIAGVVGAPFFSGFVSKYVISSADNGFSNTIFISIISFGTISYAIRFVKIFLGREEIEDKKVSLNCKMILAVLAMSCLLGGVFGIQILNFIYKTEYYISFSSFINKGILFFLSIIFAILLNKTKIKASKIVENIRELDFSFNQIAFTIPVFFSVIMVLLFIG